MKLLTIQLFKAMTSLNGVSFKMKLSLHFLVMLMASCYSKFYLIETKDGLNNNVDTYNQILERGQVEE